MRLRILALLVCLGTPLSSLFAQRKVDPAFQGERIYAIVPMVGAGTARDPRRPLFAPVHGERSAITGFTFQISDDGRSALIELIARDKQAFQSLLTANRADVKVFERGKSTIADLEREFRKVKSGFEGGKFLGGAR
jgi:hypothetical protein